MKTAADELPADERDAMYVMIEDTSGWTGTEIARALTERLGRRVGDSVITRHRRGDCTCR